MGLVLRLLGAPVCLALFAAACGDAEGGTTAAGYAAQDRGAQGRARDDAGAAADGSVDAGRGPTWFERLPNARNPLVTPTYDGSGQTVEPTVLYFPGGWRGHRYWMAVSPYPHSDASYENPSILVSEDGLVWSVPQGLANPLVEPTAGAQADATIVHDDASDELWMYYLDELWDQGVHWQLLRRMTSRDGVHWSPFQQLLQGEVYPLESPSVVKRGDEFLLWTVDIERQGCTAHASRVLLRSSIDGVHWTGPGEGGIAIPGYVVWHVTMTRDASTGRLLAAVTAFPTGTSCHRTELFLAYTSGGDAWTTVPAPLLQPSTPPSWDDKLIYRSSLLYDEDTNVMRLWYSARSDTVNAWHVGYTEGTLRLPP